MAVIEKNSTDMQKLNRRFYIKETTTVTSLRAHPHYPGEI